MHRCSESIGTIAGALAKAQAELVNPEKSLAGTIPVPGPGGGDRAFRYAPLSAGLEIVRMSLGKHEIATLQTTAIDSEGGLLRLTTVLAHSSGEWISSEWPVCPVSDIASPRRMGAALTYARRYALFTLVGIAGEDDLDAPDTGPAQEIHGNGKAVGGDVPTYANGRPPPPPPGRGNGSYGKPLARAVAPVLTPAQSSATRDKLCVELAGVTMAEQLTEWALRQLPVKNTLTSVDAGVVEEAFQNKLDSLGTVDPSGGATPTTLPHGNPEHNGGIKALTLAAQQSSQLDSSSSRTDSGKPPNPLEGLGTGIDKSVLAIGEPRRHRDKAHLRFIGSQPCLICGREPSDAHHLRFAQPQALGRKVSDEFTVPLCRAHHREVHRYGNEFRWWARCNLDPMPIAESLWRQTHPLRSTEASTAIAQSMGFPAAKRPAPPIDPLLKERRNRKTKPIDATGAL